MSIISTNAQSIEMIPQANYTFGRRIYGQFGFYAGTGGSGASATTGSYFLRADLSDNDNIIDLCLKEDGIPIRLDVNENIAIDPKDDKNPFTEVIVLFRW